MDRISKAYADQIRAERVERNTRNRQIRKLTEAPANGKQERKLKKRRRALERLVAKCDANKTKRAEKTAELDRRIDENTNDLDIQQHGLRWVSSSTE